jgi:hypothetical protein
LLQPDAQPFQITAGDPESLALPVKGTYAEIKGRGDWDIQ